MPRVRRDHEIQTLATNRADQAVAISICLWGADRRREDTEMHRLQRSVYLARVDGVAIANNATVPFAAGQVRPEPLRRPLGGRVAVLEIPTPETWFVRGWDAPYNESTDASRGSK